MLKRLRRINKRTEYEIIRLRYKNRRKTKHDINNIKQIRIIRIKGQSFENIQLPLAIIIPSFYF